MKNEYKRYYLHLAIKQAQNQVETLGNVLSEVLSSALGRPLHQKLLEAAWGNFPSLKSSGFQPPLLSARGMGGEGGQKGETSGRNRPQAANCANEKHKIGCMRDWQERVPESGGGEARNTHKRSKTSDF